MKILHLIDVFDARFDRDQIKLVELLEKRKHQNTVITSRFSSEWRIAKQTEFRSWEKRYVRVRIKHEPSFRMPNIFSKSPLPVYLPSGEMLHSFDIVHAYTFGTYSSFLGAVLKRLLNANLVMRSDMSIIAHGRTGKTPSHITVAADPLRGADAVYSYSHLEKHLLEQLGVDEAKIWVIPAGIDFAKFSKLPTTVTKGPTIGYLGRFSLVKGIHRAIPALCRALSTNERVKVIFAGMVEDARYTKSVIAPLMKFRNFQYLGELTTFPLRFFEMCNIVLVPSISETGAITVLEAMASGKTVIASDINPINEYIQHGHNGFLFRKEKDLYPCLSELVENEKIMNEIGKRARSTAEKYDWQNLIHRYEAMYRSAMVHK